MDPASEPSPAEDRSPDLALDDLTLLLDRMRVGDSAARNELYLSSFERLRQYARRLLGNANGHTLQPTAIVGEAWLRLSQGTDLAESWVDRRHFFGTLARAMRSVVIDHERGRRTLRREPLGRRVELDDIHGQFQERAEDLIALDEALSDLGQHDRDLEEVVDLRFFLACTIEETGRLLGVSRRTVERRFAEARRWLYARMQAGEHPSC